MLGLRCCLGFSLIPVSGGHSLVVVCELLIALAAPVGEHRLWGVRASVVELPGCRAQAQQLLNMGLVAPQDVGSSQTRDSTRVSCISMWILYH